MFKSLQEVVEGFEKKLQQYRETMAEYTDNNDYTKEFRQRKSIEMGEVLQNEKTKALSRALSLLEEEKESYNKESIDIAFMRDIKLLDKDFPLITLKQFLDKNKGKFNTIETVYNLVKHDDDLRGLADQYRLMQKLNDFTIKYFTINEYMDSVKSVLENYFGATDFMPTTIMYSNFTTKIDLNGVYKALNIGKVSSGEKAIEYLDGSFEPAREIKLSPSSDMPFNFKPIKK